MPPPVHPQFQYQDLAEPVVITAPEIITEDKWHQGWSTPVWTRVIAAALIAPALAFVSEPNTQITQNFESRWHQPWSEPVRVKAALPAAEQQFIAFVPFVGETITPDKWLYSWSEPVRLRQFPASEQQTFAFQPPSFEIITTDKWVYPWSEPVRQKPGLGAHLQQPFAATTLEPNTQIIQTFESRWHQPWSEPVRQKAGLEARLQQALAAPATTPAAEVITADKWLYPWTEPVRQRLGLGASSQQTLVYTTFQPVPPTPGTGLVTPVMDSVGVQYKVQHQYQARAIPVFFVAETITADKWLYAWSEPVRQKQGLGAHLQQASIATTLNPETQIIQGFESRWHQGWSEPVRVRQFPAAEQQAFTFQPPSFEVVTVDKWVYPWTEPVRTKPQVPAGEQQFAQQAIGPPLVSFAYYRRLTEPVRQKPGLGAHLQQALIATTLDDETQIIQGYESRWHYAWSEPVRTRLFPAAAQQAFAFQPPSFEIITVDKWVYPWTEPVRQRSGLRAHLQPALIATTLDDETQIIQGYESRWHYAWSEPVRVKQGLLAASQQFSTGTLFVAETITLDKWFSPWRSPLRPKTGLGTGFQQAAPQVFGPPIVSFAYYNWLTEPVRQLPGLRAFLTPAYMAPVLNPETQIIQEFESRWHYPWSEPVRFLRLAVAQYPAITQPPTSVFETVTMDKWVYPLSEPVRLKPGLRANLQQALIATTLNPETQIIQGFESRWHYAWSEPVRLKPGLRAYLQQVQPVPVLNPNTQIIQGFESRWHYAWSEPVRQKLGLKAYLQQALFFQPRIIPVLPGITGTLFATEQGDLFLAGLSAFNQVGGANVGLIEIVPRSALVGIQVDIPRVSANVGALAANPSAQSGTATALVYSANVSIRKV